MEMEVHAVLVLIPTVLFAQLIEIHAILAMMVMEKLVQHVQDALTQIACYANQAQVFVLNVEEMD